MDLQTLWFAAVAVLWTGFLLLEGFDFGVAALLPVLGRRPADRHLMLRSIGPLWDGNEVWLITAVGAVFAAFPGWYATWLPALYLPFVLVLFGLIVRAVAFEWRHSHHTERWDATWTHVITAGSLIAALGIGAALGATTLGLPIDADGTRVGGAVRRARLAGAARRGRRPRLLRWCTARCSSRSRPTAPVRLAARAVRPALVAGGRAAAAAWAGLVHLRYGTPVTAVLLAGRRAGRASSPGRGSGSTARARRFAAWAVRAARRGRHDLRRGLPGRRPLDDRPRLRRDRRRRLGQRLHAHRDDLGRRHRAARGARLPGLDLLGVPQAADRRARSHGPVAA